MYTASDHGRLVSLALLALIAAFFDPAQASPFYSTQRKTELRAMAEDTWRHAYGAYKRNAFPADELLPLSCQRQGHDRRNPDNAGVNDVMGDYVLTLVDSLDTFPMLNDRAGFEQAIREVIQHVSFDVDSRVQVFEVTIRMLGGLLSGHLLASPTPPYSSIRGFELSWYEGELLQLAHDLGKRLVPAFQTPTGIPFARVHLQRGLKGKGGKAESGETCSAGAGSLLLEFITLSRLTGDLSFEAAAKKAFFAIWNLKSDIGLIGNTIDARTGAWMHGVSGIGAGIDSFFEYAAKAYLLTGEEQYLRVWDESYAALQRYVRAPDGFWYRNVNMHTGQLNSVLVDSLSAFFPGVLTLMGDLEGAARAHAPFAFLWKRFGGLPELFDTHRRVGAHLGYPLRPEFIESNMYLYQATKDDYYLSIAEDILHDINNRTRVDCGFAAVLNLETGELEDKMPSFITAETLKYLYLTFAEDSPFFRMDDASVFTTEGHILSVPHSPRPVPFKNRKKRVFSSPSPSTKAPAPTCAAHQPLYDQRYRHFLALSAENRADWEHARWLAGFEAEDEVKETEEGRWSENGWCEVTRGEQDVGIELLFAASTALEIRSPSTSQLSSSQRKNGDVVVHSINGLRFSLIKSTPGLEAYTVSQVGPMKVREGASVVIKDQAVLAGIPSKRLEKLSLWAEVAPASSPPPPWEAATGEENAYQEARLVLEGDAQQPGRIERFLDALMAPLSGMSSPPTDSQGIAQQMEYSAFPRDPEAFYDDPSSAAFDSSSPPLDLHIPALAASFGPSFSSRASPEEQISPFHLDGEPLPLLLPSFSPYGCEAHHPPPSSLPPHTKDSSSIPSVLPPSSAAISPHLLLLHRGHCSFALKSHLAALSGASGVILISAHTPSDDDINQDGFIVPSADPNEEGEEVMKSLVPLVLAGNSTGMRLEEMVRRVQAENDALQGRRQYQLRLYREEGLTREDENGTDEVPEGVMGEEVDVSEEKQVFVTVHRAEALEEEEEYPGGVVLGGYLVKNIKLWRGD